MTAPICIFDAYGTLFDVNAAARTAAEGPDGAVLRERWPRLAQAWRDKQIGYSWLRAVTGAHCDFWQVTQDALDWALEAEGLGEAPELRERLLALYWELEAFPEVPRVLGQLKSAGCQTAILSNGAPAMLEGAVTSAGLGEVLDDVLSVEAAGIFKPASAVYDLVGQRFGCAKEEVLFVSSNGWDAAAASGYGFRTAWVNRAGAPVERLPWQPTHICSDLTDIPKLAEI